MPHSHLLYLAATWPEPASSAAGTRSLQLLSLFSEAGWHITLMCAADRRPHSAVLPDEVSIQPLTLNDSTMDTVFKTLAPDLVIFDRFMLEEQYGWRIQAQCPQALRILDTIDLHSLREIRHKALKAHRTPHISDWFSDTALRELAAIYRSDLTLLISDAEADILTRDLKFPPSLLHVLPFLLSAEQQSLPLQAPGFHGRRDFISIGNFRHPPNADAVRHLYEDLWPRMRIKCPGAALKIFGADLTPALQQLHQPKSGFHICGRAEDAIAEMRKARVCLAPLRFGAGLKGKLLDAMLGGCPSVTTSIGAEGMQGGMAWPGTVTDDPETWVDAAARLYHDAECWEQAHARIIPLLQARFDRATRGPQFLEMIHQRLTAPKNQNPDQLIGALLRHHQHRSTEFMSRWIEAKNMIPTALS